MQQSVYIWGYVWFAYTNIVSFALHANGSYIIFNLAINVRKFKDPTVRRKISNQIQWLQQRLYPQKSQFTLFFIFRGMLSTSVERISPTIIFIFPDIFYFPPEFLRKNSKKFLLYFFLYKFVSIREDCRSFTALLAMTNLQN